MFKVGDKVRNLGLCYRITKIEGNIATLRLFRITRNPRCRKIWVTANITQLEAWN